MRYPMIYYKIGFALDLPQLQANNVSVLSMFKVGETKLLCSVAWVY